ncbi:hypothetical protein BD309DRAFT_982047 [Dichomitus squalens]|uniref:Uncharacterized protein n=1 Tax=Dichomitus squalens TaxID=114155 RepID=A0A4Q9NKL4_9APHY|nr:hypothetical protein BD309DRAFT_982047 [Dichomitus squalens]TBU61538.1 hypothetical protein BD310DRAFT_904762 [Dichomitus squalens]
MFERKQYRDQHQTDRATANFRYELQPGDFSRLYRQHYMTEYNIDVSIAPEHNVDNWLSPESKYYKPEIAQSVFHYAARAARDERFKLILDGTFGLCSSRLLLWIAMGVDESRSGTPVAMFLFSAPTGTKATHAGYNTKILTELLQTWRDWLDDKRPRDQAPFAPYTAMTDTDMKERGALLRCWTNKRNSVLAFKASNSPETHSKSYVEKRLKNLEETLLLTTEHATAAELITTEERMLQALNGESQKRARDAGLAFLTYLRSTWMPPDMWRSWSRRGREDAAKKLGVTVDDVLPTTNHLEAFNGSLKRSYIPQWQHSGRRLRFDLLIYHLVISILPQVYSRHRMLTQYQEWRTERFRTAAGGLPAVLSSFGQHVDQQHQRKSYTGSQFILRALRLARARTGFTVEALASIFVAERNKCWYGPHLDRAVTAPCSHPVSSESSVQEPTHLNGPALTVNLPPPGDEQSTDVASYLARHAELQDAAEKEDQAGMVEGNEVSIMSRSEIENTDVDVSTSQRSDHAAVALQIKHQLLHDITEAAPTLYGIEAYLTDVTVEVSGTEASEIEDFRNVLAGLSAALAKVKTVVVSSVQDRNPYGGRAAEKRPAILPPSPEPMQKRKRSFKTT